MVFDDLFMTVLYMKKSEVPPNWAKLVDKSSERVTDKDYDIAKTWLFPDADLGDIAMQTNSRTTFWEQCSHCTPIWTSYSSTKG